MMKMSQIHGLFLLISFWVCLTEVIPTTVRRDQIPNGFNLLKLQRTPALKDQNPNQRDSWNRMLQKEFTLYLYVKEEFQDIHNQTLFGVYSKNKTLPYFEVLTFMHNNSRAIAVRFQGRKSFQRITFPISHVTFNRLMLWVNQTNIGLVIDCSGEIVKTLHQPLIWVPEDIFFILGQAQNWTLLPQIIYKKAVLFQRELEVRPWSCDFEEDEGMYGDSPSIDGGRLSDVMDRVEDLVQMVNMLKAQNKDLSKRVEYLESCECRPQCMIDDDIMVEGQTWQTDECTKCICQNGVPQCLRRPELCLDPCGELSCENGGVCVLEEGRPRCQCPRLYTGLSCSERTNPCVWPPQTGTCNGTLHRYYYDRFTQQCLPFVYTGCGGNMNNYETIEECESVSLTGACCYRQFISFIEHIPNGILQQKNKCKRLTLDLCKKLHHKTEDQLVSEVVSFYPGMDCKEAGCFTPGPGCHVDNITYKPSEDVKFRCMTCTCQSSGLIKCQCSNPLKRRELRTLSREELMRFQQGVGFLHRSGIWEEFRDLYMTHSMHSNGGPHFLAWNRLFLHRVEAKLQEKDCRIFLPYYDFSTDVRNLSNSILWQANYFGGDGEGSLNCVPDHPFCSIKLWSPCLTRHFNTSVQLPSVTKLIQALQSEDFTEMSSTLEAFAAYVHNFIGGDMLTTSAAYDPVFYVLHTYVDYLYWTWQNQKTSNKYKFPAVFGNLKMAPFEVAPKDVLDLEQSLCISYRDIGESEACNVTFTPPSKQHKISDIYENGYDIYGYDQQGFDRRGYNRFGFHRNGYNRDGYDIEGFNEAGYNRLGFDREGFDTYGFNLIERDRFGNVDTSGRDWTLGNHCLTRTGLNAEGFDQYGFTVDGYDVNYCNFSYHGPFSPIQSFKVWHHLLNQSPTFIQSLPRLCPAVKPLPQEWFNQWWINSPYDITGRPSVVSDSVSTSVPSLGFCVDTSSMSAACTCHQSVGRCEENPCLTSTCDTYPEALCTVDFCGGCKAVWSIKGTLVDCSESRDYCYPNPCQHGGVCVSSIWPLEPHLVTCQCPSGYDGALCQYPALDNCELPVSLGKCGENLTRWYFNPKTSSCEEFVYTGCHGNANNFPSFKACRNRCMIGACCSRSSRMPGHIHGYDLHGYDRYGFNHLGVNLDGVQATKEVSMAAGPKLFDNDGFDWRGFDQDGYDFEGLDHHGYDRKGFSRLGFNASGYNKLGEFDGIIDYKENGFDEEGFDRSGFNCYGYSRDDLDYEGLVGGYRYECRHTTIQQCQQLEEDVGEVVQFTPGQRCHQVNCENQCGCNHYNITLSFGQSFKEGCQNCVCGRRGLIECQCVHLKSRKEIRDLTKDELELFQNAVRSLSKGHNSRWFQLSKLYARYKPQFSGKLYFLPWNRYFLRQVERRLQSLHCDVTIPYFDWTMDIGNLAESPVWAANMYGTNGHGKDGCVRFHPFKQEKFPPYWTPCLRRRFNGTINLMDSVDIEAILRVKDYDSFCQKLETITSLFQTWGGGHMLTNHATYDPIFLSHLAFVDKLWDEWQKRDPDNMINFPREFRYAMLTPFATNPDGVLDSDKQLCVQYVPVGEGLPCNYTVPLYGVNNTGFDRHGYDKEGYDVRGFNQSGYSREGQSDPGGVFNIEGFDAQGFDRSGYDESGFDRDGFMTTTFNTDGFDREGYDRYGYNRYGWNRDGTLQSPPLKPKLYDKFGFNRLGFDKFGLDRNGLDVYGYDSSGFNDQKCHHYFMGPIIMIIKHSINQKLKDLDDKSLQLLERVCPGPSKLPEWIYTRNWLRRASRTVTHEEIIKLLRQYRQQSERPSFEYPVTRDGLWTPEAPDNRLCFVTYQYSECPLSQPLVSCPQELCEDRSCPRHPQTGCWTRGCGKCYPDYYDGISGINVNCTGCVDNERRPRQDNETWQTSECRICQCQRGNVGCQRIDCPSLTCQYPVKVKGQCCHTCREGCFYEKKMYKENATIVKTASPCDVCICNHGNITCSPKVCPDIHNCLTPTEVKGECCPVCLDCDGHEDGVQWNETPCLNCICNSGLRECNRVVCPDLPCDHPITTEGQCCPVCSGCFYDQTAYQDGEEFQPSPCEACRCRQGDVQCHTISCPPVECENPIQLTELCCPVCNAACEYEGTIYRHDETFNPSYDPCLNCSCSNSIVRCTAMRCPPLRITCERPIRIPGQCCPQECPKCQYNGRLYDHGEIWTPPESDCKICECREGLVSCSSNQVCGLECTHGVVPKGECCSICTDCLYDGRVIPNGRYFSRPGEACQQCRCRQGNIQCEVVDICPRLPCVKTEVVSGTCCPICKGCQHEGRFFRHNAMVPSNNHCTDCRCLEGEVDCQPRPCPPITCDTPQTPEGECCPVCIQCLFEQTLYNEGEKFISNRNPCYNCVCLGGQIDCSDQITCAQPDCEHPARVRGQCCPVCEHCELDRRRYSNGQVFASPGGDPCTVCTCKLGSIECKKLECSPVNCVNSYIPPNHCCEVCPGCSFQGGNYKEGEEFQDLSDRCTSCICQNGTVECHPKTCPTLPCTHPSRPPGDCCPTCEYCLFDRRLFRNGRKFKHPSNQCEECSCQDGSIQCIAVPCSPVSCSNSYLEPGACCPTCPPDTCPFQGQSYKQGQRFTNPSNICEECVCERGVVSCQRLPCLPVKCSHPLKGECCPSCEGCSFYGQSLSVGSIVHHPYSRCEDCTCKSGNITCEQRSCPPVTCQHPAPIDCCPSCRQCLYKNRQYRNGQRFPDVSGGCRECICDNGTVTCSPIICGSNLPCQNPAKGQCCLQCNDCEFFDRRYRNGLVFDEPTNACKMCVCRNGNVDCHDKPCPPARCANPVQGKCCPECSDCLYNNQQYEDGRRFPHESDTCQDCICQGGNVLCNVRQCPNAICSHPMRNGCCDECTNCTYLQRNYNNGDAFVDPQNNCGQCQCINGNVQCRSKPCPEVSCSHPIQGTCCQECDKCLYKGRQFHDQQIIKDSSKPCSFCQCNKGNVECQMKMCSAPSCSHPVMGECCPQCTDCLYRQIEYRNQQVFPDPTDNCQKCQCQDGDVVCRKRSCPPSTCSHPIQGQCCEECTDCYYEGMRRRNNVMFIHNSDKCKLCHCIRGNVVCRQRVCPSVTCRNPIQGECCPECSACSHNGKHYDLGQGYTDGCEECKCVSGSMRCQTLPCPVVTCSHPLTKGCCPYCDDCMYDGNARQNGEEFQDVTDRCSMCQCVEGTVRCQRKPCPALSCTHPVEVGCCSECSDCSFNNEVIQTGTEFPHHTDACQRCMCMRGSVKCRRAECPVTYCTHPVRTECCLECGERCEFEGQTLESGQSVPSGCQNCLCVKGNVQCERTRCPVLTCLHPITPPDQCCPVCDQCFYNGRRFRNGQMFADSTDLCKECKCQEGTVSCSKRSCPDIHCSHPVQGQCCPHCDLGCFYDNRKVLHGFKFPNPKNSCETCSCESGSIVCRDKTCPPPQCQFPAPDECGCGQCDDCQYLEMTVDNAQKFTHPTDICQSCYCQLGNVECRQESCVTTCSHPASSNQCCPICEQCLYLGQVYDNQQQFTSNEDTCKKCICQDGSVTCKRQVCLEPQCKNPVRREGECCFECPVCQFYGERYKDDDTFPHPENSCKKCRCSGGRVSCTEDPCVTECTHPRPDDCCPVCEECYFEGELLGNGDTFRPDPCRTCLCTNGNVVCDKKSCPELDCLKKVTDPEECCPRCSGCMYEDVHYEEGTNWILQDNPCVSCMCSNGVITCDQLSCLTMCEAPIQMPGQCCPVCPTCKYNGIMYEDGDEFHPNGDPCDVCKCMKGHLRCIHETCPNVNHCPSEQIIPAKTGVCCPKCAGFGTNCTREHLGMTLRPRGDDPCFLCECKESFNWICKKDTCEALACPVSQQKPIAGQCCPQCPVCFVRRTGLYYHEGEEWQNEDNPCITCFCKAGSVQCNIKDCPILQCGPVETVFKAPGRCCEECIQTQAQRCLFRGKIYEAEEAWKRDECTQCLCSAGKVNCQVQQCPPLNCPNDEIPSLSPGSCCPICLAKPAACMVFGDPHYKTFDGTTYHFQGTCQYVMATDCETGDFTIQVHHDDRGVEEKVSWAQNLTVKLGDFTIDLLQNHIVKTGGREVTLPYFQEPHFYVERSENTILLNTNIGVKVTWDGESTGELSVPGTYKKKLCGLCGNFNGFPQDDMKTRRGKITSSPAVFGNSWKVNSECKDAQDVDPCAKAGYRAKKIANVKCSILKSALFARCHRVISPEPFFSSCVFDMCVCSDEADCLCNILASYAHECAKAGVKLQWRSASLCAMGCPEEKGFIFDECGPPCPRTCDNKDTPLGNIEAYCFKPCIPGCQCVAGKVVHNGTCIDPQFCPS